MTQEKINKNLPYLWDKTINQRLWYMQKRDTDMHPCYICSIPSLSYTLSSESLSLSTTLLYVFPGISIPFTASFFSTFICLSLLFPLLFFFFLHLCFKELQPVSHVWFSTHSFSLFTPSGVTTCRHKKKNQCLGNLCIRAWVTHNFTISVAVKKLDKCMLNIGAFFVW